ARRRRDRAHGAAAPPDVPAEAGVAVEPEACERDRPVVGGRQRRAARERGAHDARLADLLEVRVQRAVDVDAALHALELADVPRQVDEREDDPEAAGEAPTAAGRSAARAP